MLFIYVLADGLRGQHHVLLHIRRNQLVFCCQSCNLIDQATRYLLNDRKWVAKSWFSTMAEVLKIGEFLCLYDQGGDTIEQLVGSY